MNTFFVSDLHFHHKNILKYEPRPFVDVEEMNEQLIQRWNAVVRPIDTVYNLGDFCFGKIEETARILSRLNGDHRFIVGNHDKEILNNKEYLLKEGLFKSIDFYKEISVEGQRIVLLHYGMRVWNKSHHSAWQLYGHSHGHLPPFGKSVDVGVDANFVLGTLTYAPYSFAQIKRFMDNQPQPVVDHHGTRENQQ